METPVYVSYGSIRLLRTQDGYNSGWFNGESRANRAPVHPLWESTPTHTYVRATTHILTTTSPVSGSLIKLTGAGPSGQAKTSEPSPPCHDMMDLPGTGCQAATHVHCPMGVRQQTLGKRPLDLICIYPPSPLVEGSINITSAASSSVSTCERMRIYIRCG